LDKFRGNDGNWREHIQWLEEDIVKVAVCPLQNDEPERSKMRAEREQEWVEGNTARNGIIIIIIIIMFRGLNK
jgi:hypothetical protein